MKLYHPDSQEYGQAGKDLGQALVLEQMEGEKILEGWLRPYKWKGMEG